jgi:hypothetical protein
VKKESALRKAVKTFAGTCTLEGHPIHLTWVESHQTALGAPDLQYCCYGVEGWVELKAGPNVEVRASQVIWMNDHIAAGGWPLFLIQWSDVFMIVPGSRALALRRDPTYENIVRLATHVWAGKINNREFLRVLRNPRKVYEQSAADVG